MKKYLTIFILLIVLLNCGKKFSHQERINIALNNALADCPDLKKRYDEVSKDITSITPGDLKGRDLGNTKVYSTNSYEIIIDVQEADRTRDRLEPIIAHEIYHAWEAHYDVNKFISKVNREKSLPWENRSFEQSAITYENSFRQYLLDTKKSSYKGMASTRQLQNSRASSLF